MCKKYLLELEHIGQQDQKRVKIFITFFQLTELNIRENIIFSKKTAMVGLFVFLKDRR
jgi:hypothetical protein